MLYDIKIVYGNTIKIKHVKSSAKTVCIKETENIVFVHGLEKKNSASKRVLKSLKVI